MRPTPSRSDDDVPAMPHHPEVQPHVSGPAVPWNAAAPVMAHLVPRSSARVMTGPERPRRADGQPETFDARAELRTALAAMAPSPAVQQEQQVADLTADLAAARAALVDRPALETELKTQLLTTWRAVFDSFRTRAELSPPTIIGPAVFILTLREDLLSEPDASSRILLLLRARNEMGDALYTYSAADSRTRTESERANSVALIGALLGIKGVPANAQLGLEFFEERDLSDAA